MSSLDHAPPSVVASTQVFQLMTALVVRGFGLGTAIAAVIVSALMLF